MNLNEAYSIFDLKPSATDDEIKSKYRELAKKNHPDVNKEPGSEDKFKKINEANELLKNRKNKNSFARIQEPEQVIIEKTISFYEAVKGAKVDLNYDRSIQCNKCKGEGWVRDNGGKKCPNCNDTGFIVNRRGNVITQTTCGCQITSTKIGCDVCFGDGVLNTKTSISVKIPPGIDPGVVMRLHGMGNYNMSTISVFFARQEYDDAFLKINYEPDKLIKIVDGKLSTEIEISLLEAFKGCSKSIEYIDKSILNFDIPKMCKNKDIVSIKSKGIGNDDLEVNINIKYPDDSQIELINKILEKQQELKNE